VVDEKGDKKDMTCTSGSDSVCDGFGPNNCCMYFKVESYTIDGIKSYDEFNDTLKGYIDAFKSLGYPTEVGKDGNYC
jgi:hypothetical protein